MIDGHQEVTDKVEKRTFSLTEKLVACAFYLTFSFAIFLVPFYAALPRLVRIPFSLLAECSSMQVS